MATTKMKRLKILDISKNSISHGSLQELEQALKTKTHWQKLNFSACVAAEDAPVLQFIECITNALQQSANQIEELDLSKNSLESCPELQWKKLVCQLAKCFFLSHLDISDNKLSKGKFDVSATDQQEIGFLNLRSLQYQGNNPKNVLPRPEYHAQFKFLPALTRVDGDPLEFDGGNGKTPTVTVANSDASGEPMTSP